ncbi:GTPase/DUF3482 domain-containing protein [Marinobacter sp.]|uniref:GTPase/DUF3482 domain-containing protein n=1 Tax=Marinobacter sp. TaxID=50741 RepID=UPI002B493DAF|nr:GTPase/DUF3482 domain-containing protein [Marinobacter sp.]HKK56610.1 GTPase/DUF3482 domain-containing protein [Marinobacter sp.]
MAAAPVFAVVGHPNKGKSSVVATLSQNDGIAIALEPGTTKKRQDYPLSIDGQVLYTLVDTPGFQRPRRVLEWLEAHSASVSDRADTVRAFVTQFADNPQFVDECELLAPLTEGAGVIYVVDGSIPYSPQHEAEMTILRWTGRPSLALINSIGPDDHSDVWERALGQFFQVVRRFDAVRAPFEHHLGLLKTFGQLEPDWEQPLNEATRHLSEQRQQRKRETAILIANTLENMMSYRAKRTLTKTQAAAISDQALGDELRNQWYRNQRQKEEQLRIAIEQLYQHNRIQRQEPELVWHSEHDLFSERSRTAWGVNRRYLATAGFGAGAMGGIGIDAATLGYSLGAGALIGGIVGAAGSYFYGDRLSLPVLSTGILNNGLKTASFGPVQDSQFGYVVFGRAVNHWWHISQRNHAGRELLDLGPADDHWLELLDRQSRRVIHQVFERCRKNRSVDEKTRQNFRSAVAAAMDAFDQWRLNQI